MSATITTTAGGEALRDLRRQHGLTQDQLSELCNPHGHVSQPYISQIERGEYELTARVAVAVCRALEVDYDILLAHVRGYLTPALAAA